MPVRKRGERWCVFAPGASEPIRCFPSEAEARERDRQLYPAGKRAQGRQARPPRGTQIQSLVLSKRRFPTLADARRWVSDHGFKTRHAGKAPDETENSWRFRQRDPGDFRRLRTIRLTDGVQAVVGPLK